MLNMVWSIHAEHAWSRLPGRWQQPGQCRLYPSRQRVQDVAASLLRSPGADNSATLSSSALRKGPIPEDSSIPNLASRQHDQPIVFVDSSSSTLCTGSKHLPVLKQAGICPGSSSK